MGAGAGVGTGAGAGGPRPSCRPGGALLPPGEAAGDQEDCRNTGGQDD